MIKGFPDYYDPNRIGTFFYPDTARIAEEAAASGLRQAADDPVKVALLLVDMQVDFCHRVGTLHTPGALADIRRTIEFMFRNADRISQVIASLDTHLPHQIFHPSWWVDADGGHPAPMTVITRDDAVAGRWRPLYRQDWSLQYLRALESKARKQLMIWPYHVLQGGPGHMLDAELWSAVFWHSLARAASPIWWSKGSVPETEHYSVVGPEVDAPGQPAREQRNALLDVLSQYDCVIIAGEAASHCVLSTLEDLHEAFRDQPATLRKFVVLRDCTSPVRHPEIDFAAVAEEGFARLADAGINFVRSTDELASVLRRISTG